LAKLVLTILLVPIVSGGLWVVAANAATGDARDGVTRPATSAPMELAQSGDVEIYVDEYGRRVIVDSFTGEVLGMMRPQERPRDYRRQRRLRELNRDQGGFLLDDPDDIPYRPRPYYRGRPIEEYPGYSREPIPEAPEYALPAPDEIYPDTPQDGFPEPQPRIVTRDPIERQPLDGSTAATPPETDPGALGDAAGPAVTFSGRAEVAALQVLLDRKGASPGVIDGHFGSNVDKALAAYRDITGVNLHSTDTEAIKKALAESGGEAVTSYTITAQDAAGPFVASVPSDYRRKAELDRLSFTSVAEMLAERFHMDEDYLKALNPEAVFGRPGTVIKVANVGSDVGAQVSRIIADKARKQVRAYDASGKLVAAYPATIGSSDTPSPSGTHEVSRIAFNPEYTYNPDLNFKQGDNDEILTIPPGPNGPVGSIWIALSKPTYGIHGTPDPSKIGKTESHGCVRLTNWDAAELAKLVKPGVTVQFVE
jgi:lipoprotein-anchoring transpeptidase ErfK/SrfK